MKQILCVLLAFLSVQVSAKQKNDLKNFPQGFTPKEVGARLGRHFIPGEHFLHGGKWIHYAEVCTWLGALRYAQVANDKELIDM